MDQITREYLLLFNAITDAEETLRQLREKLIFVQRQAEEFYMQECKEDQGVERCIS